MDFRLKVFHSVATNLSFTKASKELFISQPAISKHIHELEVQYKTSLFDRVGSHIGLTHAGELLLSHTKQLLAAYRQMDFEMNLLTDNFAGELRLGASTTISQYVLPPVLASFIKKFPEIKVSLLNGNSRDIEQVLREGKITLGLVEGTAHQSTLHYTPFMRDELVVVAHTGSSLAAYDEISLEQLRTLPLVLRENGSGTLDVVEAALAEHQVKLSQLNVVLQMGSTESIKLFLENSEVLGIVSIRAVTRELMSGRLKVIEVEGFRAERMFTFADHVDRRILPLGALAQHGRIERALRGRYGQRVTCKPGVLPCQRCAIVGKRLTRTEDHDVERVLRLQIEAADVLLLGGVVDGQQPRGRAVEQRRHEQKRDDAHDGFGFGTVLIHNVLEDTGSAVDRKFR